MNRGCLVAAVVLLACAETEAEPEAKSDVVPPSEEEIADGPMDPCPDTVDTCPGAERVWERDGRSICVPNTPDCGPDEVPGATGECVPLAASCGIGTRDGSGRCVYAEPECGPGQFVAAGLCVDSPAWSCPDNAWPQAPFGKDRWYVLAGGPADGDGSKDSPFTELQTAVEAADPGDAILVGAGEYGPVILKDDLLLRGLCPEKTRIDGGDVPAIRVAERQNVVVEGFGLDGASITVRVTDSDEITLRNLRIRPGASRGIDVEHSGTIAIEDVVIERLVSPPAEVGLRVWKSQGLTVTRAEVTGTTFGMYIDRVTGFLIDQSRLWQNVRAMTVQECEGAGLVRRTRLEDHRIGVQLIPHQLAPDFELTFESVDIVRVNEPMTPDTPVGIGIRLSWPQLRVNVVASRFHGLVQALQLAFTPFGPGHLEALSVRDSWCEAMGDKSIDLRTTAPMPGDVRIENTVFVGVEADAYFEAPGTQVTIERSTFESIGAVGIWMAWPKRVIVRDNAIYDGDIGLTVLGASDSVISGNLFWHTGGDAVQLGNIESTPGEFTGTKVTGNHFVAPVGQAVQVRGGTGVDVSSNRVVDAGTGDESGAAIFGLNTEAMTVRGNAIVDPDAMGISIVDGSATVEDNVVLGALIAGIAGSLCEVTVRGNTIVGTRTGSFEDGDLGMGISMERCAAEVADNTVVFNGTIGISVSKTADGPQIVRDNVVQANPIGVSLGRGGLDAPLMQVTNNTVRCAAGRGIEVDGRRADLTDNRVEHTRWDPLGQFADGVFVSEGAAVTMTSDVVDVSAGIGLRIQTGAEVVASGVRVTNGDGPGITVNTDAALVLESGSRVEANVHTGLSVNGAFVQLVNSTIENVAPFGIHARYGDGVAIQGDGELLCVGSTVTGAARVGLLVDTGSASLSGCTFSGILHDVVRQHGGTIDAEDQGRHLDDEAARAVDPGL